MGKKKAAKKKKTVSRVKKAPTAKGSKVQERASTSQSANSKRRVIDIDSSTSPMDAVSMGLSEPDAVIQVPSEEYREQLMMAFTQGIIAQHVDQISSEIDTLGFTRRDVSSNFNQYDLLPEIRHNAILFSRRLFISNGMISRLIGLWDDFTVGEGVKMHVEGNGQRALKDIFRGVQNTNVFSPEGQRETNQRLLVDGEVFLLNAATRKGMKVRRVPPEEMVEIITSPDDQDEIWGYRRQFHPIKNGRIDTTEIEERFYKDWRDLGPNRFLILDKDQKVKTMSWEKGIRVNYMKINSLGMRGNPLTLSSIGWAMAMNSFMQSRVVIERAISSFAFRLTVKGTKKDLNRTKSKFNTNIRNFGEHETNTAPSPGNMFIGNEGVDMQPMKFETGAKAAQIDGGMIVMMLGIGAGIYPHWLGAGESFRLATTKAMEPPMRKQFGVHQQRFCSGLKTSVGVSMRLSRTGVTQKSIESLRCIGPEVMDSDLNERLDTFATTYETSPWLAEIPEVNQRLLEIMGHKNPAELWNANKERIEEVTRKWTEMKVGEGKESTGSNDGEEGNGNGTSPRSGRNAGGRKRRPESGNQRRREKSQEEK